MQYTFTAFLPARAITFTATIAQAAFILSLMTHVESLFLVDTAGGALYISDRDSEATIVRALKDHFRAARAAYSIA